MTETFFFSLRKCYYIIKIITGKINFVFIQNSSGGRIKYCRGIFKFERQN